MYIEVRVTGDSLNDFRIIFDSNYDINVYKIIGLPF